MMLLSAELSLIKVSSAYETSQVWSSQTRPPAGTDTFWSQHSVLIRVTMGLESVSEVAGREALMPWTHTHTHILKINDSLVGWTKYVTVWEDFWNPVRFVRGWLVVSGSFTNITTSTCLTSPVVLGIFQCIFFGRERFKSRSFSKICGKCVRLGLPLLQLTQAILECSSELLPFSFSAIFVAWVDESDANRQTLLLLRSECSSRRLPSPSGERTEHMPCAPEVMTHKSANKWISNHKGKKNKEPLNNVGVGGGGKAGSS